MYEYETASSYEYRRGITRHNCGDELYDERPSLCAQCGGQDGSNEVCHTKTGLRVLCEACWKESQNVAVPQP